MLLLISISRNADTLQLCGAARRFCVSESRLGNRNLAHIWMLFGNPLYVDAIRLYLNAVCRVVRIDLPRQGQRPSRRHHKINLHAQTPRLFKNLPHQYIPVLFSPVNTVIEHIGIRRRRIGHRTYLRPQKSRLLHGTQLRLQFLGRGLCPGNPPADFRAGAFLHLTKPL